MHPFQKRLQRKGDPRRTGGFKNVLRGTALAFFAAACQSGAQNPTLKSDYVGRTTAEFFEQYGPPEQVIGFEHENKPDARGKIVDRPDPKELVYYWSNNNRKTYSKLPKPAGDTCTLAILSTAEGKIKLIEVQDEGGDIEAMKARCEALIQ